jgi:hypothetical protein
VSGCKHGQVVKLDDIEHALPPQNDSDHVVREIYDILQAYYEAALNRFIDNMRTQVCDYFLVTGPATPLSLFSPTLIAALPYEALEQLAMEDNTVRNRRTRLEREIEQLREGKRVLY